MKTCTDLSDFTESRWFSQGSDHIGVKDFESRWCCSWEGFLKAANSHINGFLKAAANSL
jgi:hypothetical protein